ncbi:hypothetical protein ACVWWJ_000920 [Luteibacter sp. HA06]
MNDGKNGLIVVTVAGLLLLSESTAASGNDPKTMFTPQFSAVQLEEAQEDGVDLTKADLRPGLHIVPLSDSWSTEKQANAIRTQIDQQQQNGFFDIEAEELVDLRASTNAGIANQSKEIARHDRSFSSLEEVQSDLSVSPIGLGTSDLSPATLMDVRLSGGFVDGRWTGVTRTFDVPDLGVIVLNETDHAAGRESITLIKEWINVDIHGQPGSVRTARDSSGNTWVTLGWANERKIYSLRLQPNHPEQRTANQFHLTEIAKALAER